MLDCGKLLERGRKLYNGGKFEDAVQYYNKALELNSDYVQASVCKARALRKCGKLDDALTCLEEADLEADDTIVALAVMIRL